MISLDLKKVCADKLFNGKTFLLKGEEWRVITDPVYTNGKIVFSGKCLSTGKFQKFSYSTEWSLDLIRDSSTMNQFATSDKCFCSNLTILGDKVYFDTLSTEDDLEFCPVPVWKYDLLEGKVDNIDLEIYFLAQQVASQFDSDQFELESELDNDYLIPEIKLPEKEFLIQLESIETDEYGYSWLHEIKIWADSEKEALQELYLCYSEILKENNFLNIIECGTDYEF